MRRGARHWVGVVITVSLLLGAVAAGFVVWDHYLTAPWTRDGQVQGYVVNLAPEVSGRVVRVAVRDNQDVREGDVLYEIERIDFEIAVANAEATLQSRQADMENKRLQARRRAELSTLSTSEEERQSFAANADVARAAYAGAVAQLNQARVDLQRTVVRSPVNGTVTNLLLQDGDYAVKGTRNIAVLNTDSFWIAGYFEETKLARIREGDPATALLMGYGAPVRGRVDSIARGITTPNTAPGTLGLASVNPVFTWVRLAQRIPVRIRIESVPAGVHLALGMTATVTVGPESGPGSLRGWLSRVFTTGPR